MGIGLLVAVVLVSSSGAADAAPDWQKFDDPQAVVLTDPVARQIGQLPAGKKAEAMKQLQTRLKAKEIEIRRRAALTLDKLGDKSGVPVMIAALAEATGSDRNNVVVALRILKDERAIPALREALKDRAPYVRSIAVAALGELKAKAAYDEMVAMTKDKPLEVGPGNTLNCIRMPPADLACYALGALGDKKAVPVLINLLPDRDIKEQARQALETLTGQKLGSDPAAWTAWWEKQERKRHE